MKSSKLLVLLVCISPTTFAQHTSSGPPQRDPQAVAILQQSIVTMGRQAPSDSVAMGSIVTVAGTTTDSGTIRIHTRGHDQTAEQITTAGKSLRLIYSRGAAVEFQDETRRKLSLERAVTARSSLFPLTALLPALHNLQWGLKYVGLEDLDVGRCYHIQIWQSFADRPKLQAVADVSRWDIWIEATSAMVKRVFYRVREARGDAPALPVEITFSDYRDVSGFAYPFKIETSLNGTPFSTITIESVLFNTGLVESDFPVR